jgi:Protein of unknown function (DUF2796)
MMKRHPLCWLWAGLCIACSPSLAAGGAHEHGAVKLDVAVDGGTLAIELEVPLDNLLGFERAPRTEAERKAATEVLARLRNPGTLFTADAAAQCTPLEAEVHAPVLEPGAAAAGPDEHADLEASYAFKCAQPQHLRTLDVGLFEAYRRIRRIDVQVAGPQGQSKLTLKRPARVVKLVR